jgi:hypothetical protein
MTWPDEDAEAMADAAGRPQAKARRQQRLNRVKASMLQDMIDMAEAWDDTYFGTTADALDVTTEDCGAARDLLVAQLARWVDRCSA